MTVPNSSSRPNDKTISTSADNVAVMYSGRIVEYADVEVYQQLATKLGYLAYATDKEPFIEKLSVFNKN